MASFRKGKKEYILRLNHRHDRDETAILAELDWLNFLHRRGVRVCRAIPSTQDRLVETLVLDEKNTLKAVVFEKAVGVHPRFDNPRKWKPARFEQIGRILGAIHASNRDYTPPRDIRRFDWSALDIPGNVAALLPEPAQASFEKLESFWKMLDTLPKDENGYGLIHGDFHADNMVESRRKITVIDFDNCCYCWYVFDLAQLMCMTLLPINSMGTDSRHETALMLFSGLMKGYREQYRLDIQWLERLPEFIAGFEKIFYFNWLILLNNEGLASLDQSFLDPLKKNIKLDRSGIDLDFSGLYRSLESVPLSFWQRLSKIFTG